MKNRAMMVSVLLGMYMSSNTSMAADMSEGACGLRWGTPFSEIKSRYPDGLFPSGAAVAAIKGEFDCVGFRIDAVVAWCDQSTSELSSVRFGIPPAMVDEFLSVLIEKFGEPRTLSMKDVGSHSHVLEWSRPAFGATVMFSTKGPSLKDPPTREARVTIQRGPIVEGLIETASKRQSELEAARKRKQ